MLIPEHSSKLQLQFDASFRSSSMVERRSIDLSIPRTSLIDKDQRWRTPVANDAYKARAWRLGQRGKPASLGSCFLREENVRHEFLFHSTHASPLPSLFRPLYAPFSVAFHDATSTFLLIHLLRDPPSPPPFLEEFVLSRKKKRFFFSRCTFVTSFVCFVFRRPRTRMITIRFLFSWLFIFPSRKTNEMHSSFSPWCTVRLMGRKD